jgi:hypothetical protein
MRKFVLLTLLGALTLVTWDAGASACGRRRCHRDGRASCVIVYCPAPFAPTLEARPSRVKIVSTKAAVSPSGHGYLIHQTSYQDAHEEAQVTTAPETFTLVTGDDFRGTDRKAAKTSIVAGDPQPYASIQALLAVLPPDADMMAPGISKAEDSQRVAAEERNVTVPAYIYAASREKDNDFHVVLGGPDALNTGYFMNAEVSGLPTGPFRQRLTVPRQAFKDYFGADLPGRSYALYEPPIPVTVTGSLFYDVDHAPGVVGPDGYKPQTAWEIHPVSSITFVH